MNEKNYQAALDRATEALGTRERARDWLQSVSRTLGSTPQDLCASEEGFKRVMRHIHSVEIALATDC